MTIGKYSVDFCRSAGRPMELAEVLKWSSQFPQFHLQERRIDNQELWYTDVHTGVFFCLESMSMHSPGGNGFPVGGGMKDSGWSFHIDCLCPSFFALEAMPIVEDFCQRFGLLGTVLCQESDTPSKMTCQGLIHSWEQAKLALLEEYLAENPAPPFMPHEQAQARWQYMRRRSSLAYPQGYQREGDVVRYPACDAPNPLAVPAMWIIQPVQTCDRLTAFTWLEGTPMIFPSTDLVILARPGRRFLGFGGPKEIGVVSGEHFMQHVHAAIEPIEDWPGCWRFRSGVDAKEARRLFDSLPIDTPASAVKGVSANSFVDVTIQKK